MLGLSSPCCSRRASSFKTDKKAARVLPVPVGEMINTFLPASIFGQAASWAGVGSSKVLANQSVTTEDLRGSFMGGMSNVQAANDPTVTHCRGTECGRTGEIL